MNKDRIVGSIKQAQGSVEKAAGKVLGDTKMQIDGAVKQAEGKAQNTTGAIKDILKP